jgi:hypothetical protein
VFSRFIWVGVIYVGIGWKFVVESMAKFDSIELRNLKFIDTLWVKLILLHDIFEWLSLKTAWYLYAGVTSMKFWYNVYHSIV